MPGPPRVQLAGPPFGWVPLPQPPEGTAGFDQLLAEPALGYPPVIRRIEHHGNPLRRGMRLPELQQVTGMTGSKLPDRISCRRRARRR